MKVNVHLYNSMFASLCKQYLHNGIVSVTVLKDKYIPFTTYSIHTKTLMKKVIRHQYWGIFFLLCLQVNYLDLQVIVQVVWYTLDSSSVLIYISLDCGMKTKAHTGNSTQKNVCWLAGSNTEASWCDATVLTTAPQTLTAFCVRVVRREKIQSYLRCR